MKKVKYAIYFIVFFLITQSCSDDNQKDTITQTESNLYTLAKLCGNNQYPGMESNEEWYIEWCQQNSQKTYSRKTIRLYWSHLVNSVNGVISRNYSCEGPTPYTLPKKTTIISHSGNSGTLRINWSFVWCNYYIVQKQYDNSSGWYTVASLQNDHHQAQTYYDFTSMFGNQGNYRINTEIDGSICYGDPYNISIDAPQNVNANPEWHDYQLGLPVTINWDASNETEVTGYEILRQRLYVSNGQLGWNTETLIKTINARTISSWIDYPNWRYPTIGFRYRVRAISTTHNLQSSYGGLGRSYLLEYENLFE